MTQSRILFVCTGNICRSPTAEGVLRHKLATRGLSKTIEVASAGTQGYHVGSPPDPRSQAHAAARGYDLSRQRARKLSDTDYETFDHVLAMDHENLEIMASRCPPHHRQKVALLMRFARRHQVEVVPDPYYGGPNGFEMVLDYIEDACDGLIETVLAQRQAR